MSVRLTPLAVADLREVFGWYSERGAALGLEFLAAFAEAERRIGEFPDSAPTRHRDPTTWRLREPKK